MLGHIGTSDIVENQAPPSPGFCEERYRLLDAFVDAVHELNRLHDQQIKAVIGGDRDFARFDPLIYLAQERKEAAKYTWMVHIETHHCEEDLWP